MIIVQTPLRVSLFGGGTDFPAFFQEEDGCVLTTAIDKYVFVIIKKRFDDKLRVAYTKTEIVDSIEEIQHELIRESFRKTGIKKGVEIATMGDIPAGSGLGSSAAVTVGALHAMYLFRGEIVPADWLAKEACEIEIDILQKPVGVQDQYIAAYGGLRFIRFSPRGTITCEKLTLDPALYRRLDDNLLLYFTGVTRHSEEILTEQKEKINQKRPELRQLREMATLAKTELQAGNLDQLGLLLHESWLLKKQLASQVSNGRIEEIYEKARRAGALGGKITGAGGGGFLLLYCPLERCETVRRALSPLRELPFVMEAEGTKVIFNHHR